MCLSASFDSFLTIEPLLLLERELLRLIELWACTHVILLLTEGLLLILKFRLILQKAFRFLNELICLCHIDSQLHLHFMSHLFAQNKIII